MQSLELPEISRTTPGSRYRGPARTDAAWLAPWWKKLGRRYGHVFHSLCSYMGSFPPGLPRYLIEQFTDPGDIVVDPFSGRGTSALEACLAGRRGVGIDLNPLAAMLTAAKIDPPTLEDALRRLEALERSYRPEPVGERAPPEIRMLFDERVTLPQILHMKAALDPADRTDRFLLASLAGILHGNHTRDVVSSRCLSVSMPNTFSMSPGYLARYIREKNLVRPPFDAFEKMRLRMHFEFAEGVPGVRGTAVRGDARKLSEFVAPGSARLVVTSPPYLNVVRYGKFNWIRLWLLGESVNDVDRSLRVEATDRRLALSDRLRFTSYCAFLGEVLAECSRVLRDDGICVVTIGDVQNREHGDRTLALEAWDVLRDSTDLELGATIADDVNALGKVSKIWGEGRRGEATKVDRLLILHKRGQGMPKPRWRDPEALVQAIAASPNSPLAAPGSRPGIVRARPEQAAEVRRAGS